MFCVASISYRPFLSTTIYSPSEYDSDIEGALPFPVYLRHQRVQNENMSSDRPNTNVERLRTPRTIGHCQSFYVSILRASINFTVCFLVTTLGTSALTVGAIEGIAESTPMIVKIFSGDISDFIGQRKVLLLLG